jgi:hypothetical protein
MGQPALRFIRRKRARPDYARSPSVVGHAPEDVGVAPKGPKQISLGQSDAARAASDAPGCESRETQALKGRNNCPASPVSPFQGW